MDLHRIVRVFNRVMIIVLTLFMLLILIDFVKPFILVLFVDKKSCNVMIIDMLNLTKATDFDDVCFFKALDVDTFRILGIHRVRIYVIVAHGLQLVKDMVFLRKGSYAIETSEDISIWTFISHPLMILAEAVVIGRPFNQSEERLALTQNIFAFTYNFNNSIIVLLTCGTTTVKEFARNFIEKGASMVLFFDKFISLAKIRTCLKTILTYHHDEITMIEKLISMGMKIVKR